MNENLSGVSRANARILRGPKASLEDKRLALRFIVHIIGGIHQPFHAGGVNDFKATWFDKSTKLHVLWDVSLIEQRSLSYSECAPWLSRSITPAQVVVWSDWNPANWARENIALRETIYSR